MLHHVIYLFKPACILCTQNVPFLLLGAAHRPADIFVQPCPPLNDASTQKK